MEDFLKGLTISIITFIVLLFLGFRVPIEEQIVPNDQRTCGTDLATHVYSKFGKRLVICERPGGLVVVEVKGEK